MKNTISYPNDRVTAEEQQAQYLKWELPFRQLLNEIYWDNYAEDLMENDPEAYAREYWYFIRIYD